MAHENSICVAPQLLVGLRVSGRLREVEVLTEVTRDGTTYATTWSCPDHDSAQRLFDQLGAFEGSFVELVDQFPEPVEHWFADWSHPS